MFLFKYHYRFIQANIFQRYAIVVYVVLFHLFLFAYRMLSYS